MNRINFTSDNDYGNAKTIFISVKVEWDLLWARDLAKS